MNKVCHDCHVLIFGAMDRANKEVSQRLDAGESHLSLFLEYDNRLAGLLGTKYEDEEFWFLQAASHICIRGLGLHQVYKEGWTRNHSHRWVKKTLGE